MHPLDAPGPFVPLVNGHASTVLELKKGAVLRVRNRHGEPELELEVLALSEHASTVRVTLTVDALRDPGGVLLEKVRAVS